VGRVKRAEWVKPALGLGPNIFCEGLRLPQVQGNVVVCIVVFKNTKYTVSPNLSLIGTAAALQLKMQTILANFVTKHHVFIVCVYFFSTLLNWIVVLACFYCL
jgi:hypothetical protein